MSSSIPGPSRPDDGSGDDADEKGKFPSDAPAGTDSQKRRRKKRDKSDRNTVSLFGTASLIAPSKAGWLTKQGKVVKNWKKRWFVVKDGTMLYFKEPTQAGRVVEPKGDVPLMDVTLKPCSATIGKQNAFEIRTRDRIFYMFAETQDEMTSWMDVISRNVTTVRSLDASASSVGGPREVFVKVLVLGDSCVGKTSLVARWRGEKFSSKYKETEGSSFTQRKSTFEGWMITICCWDIGGGSRFVEYLHGSHAVIICYDTTSFASLGKAKKICRDVSAEVPGIVPIIVGTKTDLAEDRKVEEGLGDTFAHEVGGMHLETSAAKDPSSCESAFFHVMKSLQSLGRLKDLPKTPEGFM